MKKSTRRTMMMSSLAMLIVAVLALGTATYAWFTTSNTGSITNIQFQAQAAGGIEFSLNGVDGWKSNLQFSDFGLDQAIFYPVSTDGSVSNSHYTMYLGTIPEGVDTITTTVDDGTNYYLLPYYVRNASDEDITVTLTNSTTVQDGNEAIHTTYATRVGFIVSGDAADYQAGQTAANISDASAPRLNKIYEAASVNPYFGITAEGTLAPDTANNRPHIAASGQAGVAGTATSTTSTATDINFQVPAHSIVKVYTYVWLEGQDIDCDNALGSGIVNINLFFEKS